MLPLAATSSSHYVAAAYIVFLVLVLSYVAIMASKITRIERDLRELNDAAERREA